MSRQTNSGNWLIAGFYNGLQKLSVPLFGVASTMILAHRALTKDEMGVWSIFLIITSFVELIRQALVKTSLIKYINDSEKEDQKFVLSAALSLNMIITFVLIIVMLLSVNFGARLLHSPQLPDMIFLFFSGMLLLIPFSHFEWLMYSKSQFRGLFWTFFVRQGLSLLLIVIAMYLNGKVTLNELVMFYNCGILAGTVIAYNYTKHHLEKTFVLTKAWMLRLWHFGKYVFGTGVSTLIFGNAAQVMAAPLLGSTSFTASQSIGARVINLADMPSAVLSDLLFPKSSSKENSGNRQLIKYYYEKTVGATLCFALPMVLFILLFPKFIILVIAGRQYMEAIPYLRIIAVSGLFLAFLKHFGVIIDSTGKPHVNFTTISFVAVLQVVLCYFFIRQFGFLGAGYALIVSHIVAFIVSQYILHRYFGVYFMNCFKYAFQFYPELFKMVFDRKQWKTN